MRYTWRLISFLIFTILVIDVVHLLYSACTKSRSVHFSSDSHQEANQNEQIRSRSSSPDQDRQPELTMHGNPGLLNKQRGFNRHQNPHNPNPRHPRQYHQQHRQQQQELVEQLWTKFGFSEQEKSDLSESMKAKVSQVVQEYCLPKIVCELHASLTSRWTPLTKSENELISYLRETSYAVMGDGAMSKLHFASHLGQLLSGVEGNGCYNIFSECPLTKVQALRMAKNIRIRSM